MPSPAADHLPHKQTRTCHASCKHATSERSSYSAWTSTSATEAVDGGTEQLATGKFVFFDFGWFGLHWAPCCWLGPPRGFGGSLAFARAAALASCRAARAVAVVSLVHWVSAKASWLRVACLRRVPVDIELYYPLHDPRRLDLPDREGVGCSPPAAVLLSPARARASVCAEGRLRRRGAVVLRQHVLHGALGEAWASRMNRGGRLVFFPPPRENNALVLSFEIGCAR